MLNLEGMSTADGWVIQAPVNFAADHTGGRISLHYVSGVVCELLQGLGHETRHPMEGRNVGISVRGESRSTV